MRMHIMKNKKIVITGISLFLLSVVQAQTKPQAGFLLKGFQTPAESVKPSTYWHWLNDNISSEGVVKDIDAMAKIGVGRAFIGNIGLGKDETPYGTVKFFSDEWWKVTEAAIKAASKKGIDIGLFNSPGWSQSGGPWIKPEQSMRYLKGVEWKVKGPKKITQSLKVNDPDFQHVLVLAYPIPASDGDHLMPQQAQVRSSSNMVDAGKVLDGDTASYVLFPDTTTSLDFNIAVAQSYTARSINIFPAPKPFKAMAELQAGDDGNFKTIRRFEIDRSNPQHIVGFIPYAPISISFLPVTAKQFRIVLTNIWNGGGLAEIQLSAAPMIERFMEKQLAKMYQTPLPLWKEYQWPQQAEPESKYLVVDPTRVINLSSYLDNDVLNWTVPEGNWVIVRYGMLPTGVTNSPATPEGKGLEIDKLNKDFTQHHFDAFVGKVQKRILPADRKSLKWLVADSYETGSQNWTNGMADDFKKRYRYDPLPWLPVLSGRIVETAEKSNRFLWDLRRFIADRVSYEYVGGLRKVGNANGLKLWLENYGHWGYPGEFLQYGGQADEVAGEFWNEGDLGSIENRAASSAAHIYGKAKVSSESFTAAGAAYMRYPALLKKRGDWSFTEGINNTLLHVFIEQPYDDKVPGINAGYGTEFNRNNTWFYQGKAFVDYIRRCNFLLQQGKPVNDVAYFIGEDAPKMIGVRNPELPSGYQFDYINAEVIMNRLTVKNGRWTLPDGLSYKLLVLPPLETMRPELLQKIKDGVTSGGIVLGPAPERSPSMENYPAADNRVQQLAAALWANVDGKKNKWTKHGKGMVLNGMTMEETLALLKLVPDFTCEDPTVLFTHRTTPDGEIYFITNQTDKQINITPQFRIAGKQPEWWDAVSGKTRLLPQFEQTANTTIVPITLEAYGSGFVVFRKEAVSKASANKNFPDAKQVLGLSKPWTVSFDASKRGPDAPVVFNELIDWSKHTDDRIRNYSGTAVYKTSFTYNAASKGETIYLNLGAIKVMAKVKLNGKDVGSVWTAPWQVDISSAVTGGENSLEIEVVNTWINRLIGDSKLPQNERKTWSNINPYNPQSPYDPSGLMGPVTIQAVKY